MVDRFGRLKQTVRDKIVGNWFSNGNQFGPRYGTKVGPNARTPIIDLISASLMQVMFHSQNVSPESI